jgi:hypothetical protein
MSVPDMLMRFELGVPAAAIDPLLVALRSACGALLVRRGRALPGPLGTQGCQLKKGGKSPQTGQFASPGGRDVRRETAYP